MRVLVACEFSGIVREAFRKRGHDAWSCDLLPTEIPGKHIEDDVIKHLKGWDLIIAHPPCTYLSNAGARFLYPKGILDLKRLSMGLDAARFFIKLLKSPCQRVCVENPIPSLAFQLPPYSQIVQPYYFGDPFQKKTCLWLRGIISPLRYKVPENKPESTKIPGNWFNKGGKERQKNRARTFQGIANAMAEQWG